MTEPHISDAQLVSHIEHIRHYGLDTHGRTFLSRSYIIDLHDARNEIARLKAEIEADRAHADEELRTRIRQALSAKAAIRARALEEAAESIEHRGLPSNSDEFQKGWNRALAVATTIIRAAITEPSP